MSDLSSDVPMDSGSGEAPQAIPTSSAGGEPEVVVSTVSTDTAAAEGGPGEITIEEYEVGSGDTLLSIALKFNASPDELRSLNNLRTDLIQIGQVISVPVKPAEPTPTPEPFSHVVQAGESLTGIAARYGVSWADIVQVNRLPDANALRAGMELIIPGFSPTAGSESTDEEGVAAVADPAQQATHTIKAGQTLTQIAQMYDIPLGELQRANNIANASLVKPGQVLTLPGLTVAQAIEALSTTHTVAAGESLSQIAKDYGVPMSEIMRANNMNNADLLRPGQQLIIPPASN